MTCPIGSPLEQSLYSNVFRDS